MDLKTKDHFGRISDGLPKEKRGHAVRCRTVGLKVVCTCSCGAKYQAKYGNTAGWSYSVAYARRWYLKHTGQPL